MSKIYIINQKEELHQENEISLLKKYNNYLKKGLFEKIIVECEPVMKKNPRSEFLYIVLSTAYEATGNYEKAKNVLKKAQSIFPDSYEVLFNLAKVHETSNENESAERYYKKAIKLAEPVDKEAASDFLNDLGAMYFSCDKKEEAAELWKKSLKLNPQNKTAKMNLKNITLKENMPDQKLLAEIERFKNIQVQKYFNIKNRDEFDTHSEADKVLGSILSAWNEKMAPIFTKIENMSVNESLELYKNTRVDFSLSETTRMNANALLEQMDLTKFGFDSNNMKKVFENLPEDAVFLISFGFSALERVGLDSDRMFRILKSGKPTKKEKLLFEWVYDFMECLYDAFLYVDDDEYYRDLIGDAFRIMIEKLEISDAAEEIELILDAFENYENMEPDEDEDGDYN